MRLIDAEELGFEILENTSDQDETANMIYGFVINAPTIDAVPVVRCRDCKQCRTEWGIGKWYGSCKEWNTHSVMADWFCINGERKCDETD